MNLSAYDKVTETVDKQKTWIDTIRYQLISREIKYRPYFTILKRYDSNLKVNDYFVALLDNVIPDRICFKTKKDNYGRIKINLKSIWEESNLLYFKNESNISIEHVEEESDGDIYKLNI